MTAPTGPGAPDLLTISIDALAGGSRLVVAGEIDALTAPQLEEVAAEVCKPGEDLRVDLSSVAFLDSSGLRVLVGIHQRLESAGCRLILEHVHPRAMKVLAATHLDQVLTFDAPVAEGGGSPAAG